MNTSLYIGLLVYTRLMISYHVMVFWQVLAYSLLAWSSRQMVAMLSVDAFLYPFWVGWSLSISVVMVVGLLSGKEFPSNGIVIPTRSMSGSESGPGSLIVPLAVLE